jgi:hypothetical protein
VIFKKRKMRAEVFAGTMLGWTWRAGIELVTVITATEAIPSSLSHNCMTGFHQGALNLHHLSSIAFLDFTDCNNNFNPGDPRIYLALVSSTPSQFTKPVSQIFDRSDSSGIWGKRWCIVDGQPTSRPGAFCSQLWVANKPFLHRTNQISREGGFLFFPARAIVQVQRA